MARRPRSSSPPFSFGDHRHRSGARARALSRARRRAARGSCVGAMLAADRGGLGRWRGPGRVGAAGASLLLAGACVGALPGAPSSPPSPRPAWPSAPWSAIGSAPGLQRVCSAAPSPARPLPRRWAAATALACAGVCAARAGRRPRRRGVGAGGRARARRRASATRATRSASKRMLAAGGAPEAVMAAVFGTGALLLLPLFALVPAGGLLAPGGYRARALPRRDPHGARLRAVRPRPRAPRRRRDGHADARRAAHRRRPGVIVLGERPGLAAAAGAALVLGGLAAAGLRPAKRRAPRAPRLGPRHLAALEAARACCASIRARVPARELQPGLDRRRPGGRPARADPRRRARARRPAARARADRALRRGPPLASGRRCARWPPRAWSTIEPNRGASVARLDAAGLRSLFELRTALELEAAHLALERNGGRLPDAVHAAVRAPARGLRPPAPRRGARWPRPTTPSTSRSSTRPPASASRAPTTASPARCACS